MTSTAIVNRIENNQIYLMHIVDYGQKEQTEREFWNVKKRDFKADNPSSFELSEGDAIQYFIPEGKTIVASFFVLIFPLVAFLVSFGVLSAIGFQSDKLIALISVGVMGISFSINKLFKKFGLKETLPIITEKVSKETLKNIQTECKDCGSCTICN